VKKLGAVALALALGALAAPAQAQMVTFPGEWGWLDPWEWGKHVNPLSESKWQRRDRLTAERQALEKAQAQAWAQAERRRRAFEAQQAQRLGFPPAMAGTLDNALRSAHVAKDPFSDWKLSDVRRQDIDGAAWVRAHQTQEGRAVQANRWLLGYDSLDREEPFRPDRMYGALERHWQGGGEDIYSLDPEWRYRPDWLSDGTLGELGIRPGQNYSEAQAHRFGSQLNGYLRGLPGSEAVAQATGADPRMDWAVFSQKMGGFGRQDWVQQVNQYRAGLGDPALGPLPVLPAGFREGDEFLRSQSPVRDAMPEQALPVLGQEPEQPEVQAPVEEVAPAFQQAPPVMAADPLGGGSLLGM